MSLPDVSGLPNCLETSNMKTETLLDHVGSKVTLEDNRDGEFCETIDCELEHITKNTFRVGITYFRADEITSSRMTPSSKVLQIIKDHTCAVTPDRSEYND
jgi:hypothetical protein